MHCPNHAPRRIQEIVLRATDSEGAVTTAMFEFLVLPENDPPVLKSTYATYDSSTKTHDGLSDVIGSVDLLTVKEDKDIAVPGLAVRDVDLDVDGAYIFGGDPGPKEDGLLEITLHASNGTISLGAGAVGYIFLVGDGVDDRILAFRASLAGINRALAGLTYRGRPDFYGTDDLVVTVDDRGNHGWGALCFEPASRGVHLGDDYTSCPQVVNYCAKAMCDRASTKDARG